MWDSNLINNNKKKALDNVVKKNKMMNWNFGRDSNI